MSYSEELFYTQRKKGKVGERKIIQLMQQRGHQVIDLTDDSRYYAEDVDFIIAGKKCELKTDYIIARTNNLFLETKIEYMSDKEDKEGYFAITKAEYLFYLDEKNNVLYIYTMEQLKDYIDNNYVVTRICNDGYKKVYGYCLNKDKVPHQTIQIA